MSRSHYKPRPPLSLKAAETELVEAVGGALEAAGLTRLSKTHIHRATDPDESETHLPADVVAVLQAACGKPVVSLWQLDQLGWTALPPIDDGSEGLPRDLAGIGEWAAQLFHHYGEALAPDDDTPFVIDAEEALQLLEDTNHLLAVLLRAKARLAELAAEGVEKGRGA